LLHGAENLTVEMSGSSLASAASSTHPSTAVSSPIEPLSEKPNLPKTEDVEADGSGSNMEVEGQKEEQQQQQENELDPEAEDEEGMDLKAKALTKLLKTSSVRALRLAIDSEGFQG
jgi:hypothetical protein